MVLPAPVRGAAGLSHLCLFRGGGLPETRSLPRYALRLGVMAAVSQIPFSLASKTLGGSMMLTLFLGVAAVWLSRRLQERGYGPGVCLVPLLCACAAALLTGSDYGRRVCCFSSPSTCAGRTAGGAALPADRAGADSISSITPSSPCSPSPSSPPPAGGAAGLHPAPACDLLPVRRGQRAAAAGLQRGAGPGFKWFFYWFYPCICWPCGAFPC